MQMTQKLQYWLLTIWKKGVAHGTLYSNYHRNSGGVCVFLCQYKIYSTHTVPNKNVSRIILINNWRALKGHRKNCATLTTCDTIMDSHFVWNFICLLQWPDFILLHFPNFIALPIWSALSPGELFYSIRCIA